jgi:7-keto-8-aminopelargonate synthetase-like enzyme
MSVAANLEETYGGRFPNEVLHTLHTLRDLVFAVEKHLGDKPAPQPREPAADAPTDVLGQYRDHVAMPGYRRLKEELSRLAAGGAADPCFHVQERGNGASTVIDGREVVDFSSCDYLGMSVDPVVTRAAKDAIDRFGTSVSASRYASGQTPLHRDLENALATFFGAGDAVVCAGQQAANESTIGHLMGPGDLILHDSLAQDGTVRGAILSGAERREFPHNDWAALNTILGEIRRGYQKVLIAVEGVFGRDGDHPELPRFVEVKNAHQALLLVDETHSAGTMGRRGRGLGEHFDLEPSAVDICTGTLGACFGSCGSFVAGPAELIDYLKHTAPEFVASTGLSPPNVAAALSALRLLEESPERVAQCQARSRLFLETARRSGLNTGRSDNAPIVPVVIGNSLHTLTLSGRLLERGFYAPPLVYPMADEAAARLRFFVTALHTEQQIQAAVDALAGECREMDPTYVAGGENVVL